MRQRSDARKEQGRRHKGAAARRHSASESGRQSPCQCAHIPWAGRGSVCLLCGNEAAVLGDGEGHCLGSAEEAIVAGALAAVEVG